MVRRVVVYGEEVYGVRDVDNCTKIYKKMI